MKKMAVRKYYGNFRNPRREVGYTKISGIYQLNPTGTSYSCEYIF